MLNDDHLRIHSCINVNIGCVEKHNKNPRNNIVKLEDFVMLIKTINCCAVFISIIYYELRTMWAFRFHSNYTITDRITILCYSLCLLSKEIKRRWKISWDTNLVRNWDSWRMPICRIIAQKMKLATRNSQKRHKTWNDFPSVGGIHQ